MTRRALTALVVAACRHALLARLGRRSGARLLERPLRALAAATARRT
jgi:hypothetical protein